jgi:hypothetical protein
LIIGITRNRLAIFVAWLSFFLLFVVEACDEVFNAFKGYAAKYGVVLMFSFIVTDFNPDAVGTVFIRLERQNRKIMS